MKNKRMLSVILAVSVLSTLCTAMPVMAEPSNESDEPAESGGIADMISIDVDREEELACDPETVVSIDEQSDVVCIEGADDIPAEDIESEPEAENETEIAASATYSIKVLYKNADGVDLAIDDQYESTISLTQGNPIQKILNELHTSGWMLKKMEDASNPGTYLRGDYVPTGDMTINAYFAAAYDITIMLNGASRDGDKDYLTMQVPADSSSLSISNDRLKTLSYPTKPIAYCGLGLSEKDENPSMEVTPSGDQTYYMIWKTAVITVDDIKPVDLTASEAAKNPAMPDPTVYANGKLLVKGEDYEVAYSANNKLGFAKATITGTGGYRFTKAVSFLVQDPNDEIATLITRCYETFLGREPDKSGWTSWVNLLKKRDPAWPATQVLAVGFLNSKEFKSKVMTDDEFVTCYYRTIFKREPDTKGKNGWLKYLQEGCTRDMVTFGFVNSKELQDMCARNNVIPGWYNLTNIRDKNPKVSAFVARLYTTCMGRSFDDKGMTTWVTALVKSGFSAKTVADSFYNSTEFKKKNLSNEDFVKNAYMTILGRNPSQKEVNSWAAYLKSNKMTRQQVLNGFYGSSEFTKICQSYGVKNM